MIESEIRTLLQTIAIQTRKNYAQKLRELGLHIGQELALFHLWEQEGLTQSQLRNKIGTEASTMSNMLRKLERDEIVYRTPDEQDHRITNDYLTKKGKQLKEPITQMWKEHEQEMFNGIESEKLQLLQDILQKVKSNLA